MTATLSFIWSILISLGMSVSADNIGDTFSTIYANQDPAVQKRIDIAMRDPALAATLGSLEFTADCYAYTQGIDPANPETWNVDNDIIQESVGIEGWKDFIESNQNNAISNNPLLSWSDPKTGYYIKNVREYNFHVDWSSDLHSINGLLLYDSDGNYVRWLGGSAAFHDDWFDYMVENSEILSFKITDPSTGAYEINFTEPLLDGTTAFRTTTGTCPEFIDSDYVHETSSEIGEATAEDGSSYPISSDGSIILPDGTVITPNADGTYTIDGNVYSPVYNLSAYNDSALLGLLQQILQKLNDLELEGTLEFENEIENDSALENVNSYEGSMSEFIYSSPKWTTVFPFCIPWDFVRGVKLLSAAPVAPKFEIPFEIPAFGLFNGYKTVITFDFGTYEKYFYPVRWFTTIFFLMGLGFLTFKIVKGAR